MDTLDPVEEHLDLGVLVFGTKEVDGTGLILTLPASRSAVPPTL